MDRRHAVHGKTIVDIDMRHMYLIVLIDDPYILILRVFLPHPLIQFFDNRHKLGHYLLQIFKRPFFQRFRQDRMVCISAGFAHHLDRLIQRKCLILHQNPDQFRNDHRRMRIVDLDHTVIMQFL